LRFRFFRGVGEDQYPRQPKVIVLAWPRANAAGPPAAATGACPRSSPRKRSPIMRVQGQFPTGLIAGAPVGRQRFHKVAKNAINTCISLKFAYNAATSYTMAVENCRRLALGSFCTGRRGCRGDRARVCKFCVATSYTSSRAPIRGRWTRMGLVAPSAEGSSIVLGE